MLKGSLLTLEARGASLALSLALSVGLMLLGSCQPAQEGVSGILLPDLTVQSVGPAPIVPGTELLIRGTGFPPAEVAETLVIFSGAVAGRAVTFAVLPERLDDETLAIGVAGDIQAELLGDLANQPEAAASFEGVLTIQRGAVGSLPASEQSGEVSIPLAGSQSPTALGFGPMQSSPGGQLEVSGSGFLHPSEGLSLVRFDGGFLKAGEATETPIPGLTLPALPVDPMRRDLLAFDLSPDLLGLRPGRFTGTVTVINEHFTGHRFESPPLSVNGLEVQGAFISSVEPLEASRGQRVDFLGQGLIPTDPVLQAGSVFILEGDFTPNRGNPESWVGENVRALFPDFHDGPDRAGVVLRVEQFADGELGGLGHRPGVFEGLATPLLFFGEQSVVGQGVPLTLTINPPRQVVYLKLLPAFDDALVAFGLLVEREVVIQRILDVCARDYAGVNVVFTTEIPTDFVEYSTVEIGGEDPNGSGLFGLDNTAGKDTGNLRFNDVLGGFNADTRAQGYAAYGGIFPKELLNLSPRLSDSPLTSDRFDDVFAAFAPPLGGAPALYQEAISDSVRAVPIQAAVIVLGNLIGNIVTHEVGHSLGLSATSGQFHNVGDSGPHIMDAGVHRPFEERAEIDGFGPSVFSTENRNYLQQILPVLQ